MQLVLPKKRYYLNIVFLLIWFYAMLELSPELDSNTFFIFITIFIIPIVFFLYVLLYNIFGTEMISFDGKEFIVTKRILFYRNKNYYDLCEINNFSFSHEERNIFGYYKSALSFWGIGNGGIQFTYYNKLIKFGIGLNNDEVNPIIIELNEKLKEMKSKNCV